MKQKKYPHQKEIEELKAGWQRTQADFDNFRKRIEVEKKDWAKLGKTELILEFLPVLDNFERATAHLTEKQMEDPLIQGILQIRNQLLDVLKNNRVEPIDPQPGEKFNPQFHEAVEGKGEKIQAVRLKGYRLGEKVLRPAQVTVKR